MNRFARWIVKHRVAIVIICLLMLIPSVLGMNATKVKYDLLYYLPEDLDTVKGQNILMEEFGKGAFSLCITEGMSETDQQALEDAIRALPGVSEAYRHEQLAALGVAREVLQAATRMGRGAGACMAARIRVFSSVTGDCAPSLFPRSSPRQQSSGQGS